MESEKKSTPWWLWPNLLSLDAPLIALIWVEILARATRVQSMQWESRAVLVLCVWIIYVVDRLLDATKAKNSDEVHWLRKRHEFHLKWRWPFLVGVFCASLFVTWILLYRLGPAITVLGSSVCAMALGYFVIATYRRSPGTVEYFKNLVAGMTFAAGVAVPVFYHAGMHNFFEIVTSRSVLFVGMLACLNITAIDLWEHAALATDDEEKDASEVALSLPLILLGGVSFFVAMKSPEMTMRWAMYAVFISAACLQVLNRFRNRFSIDALRALADFALVVPFFVLIDAVLYG